VTFTRLGLTNEETQWRGEIEVQCACGAKQLATWTALPQCRDGERTIVHRVVPPIGWVLDGGKWQCEKCARRPVRRAHGELRAPQGGRG
jgi:hypothetical protein